MSGMENKACGSLKKERLLPDEMVKECFTRKQDLNCTLKNGQDLGNQNKEGWARGVRTREKCKCSLLCPSFCLGLQEKR